MKNKPLFFTLALTCVAALLVSAPQPSNGQAAGADDAEAGRLIAEIMDQQAKLESGNKQNEAKLAAIAEDIRLAKIFVGRAGGGRK